MSALASTSALAATFVYVSNAEDGEIGAYSMQADGALKALARVQAAKVVMPMAVSPNRRLLYAASYFAKVPVLSLWGDNSVGAKQTVNGDARRNGCRDAVNAIKAAGGRAALAVLPDLGIRGNSHMMMMDRNNLQVADVILKWLAENAAR